MPPQGGLFVAVGDRKNTCVPENHGEPRPWFGVRAAVELRAFGRHRKAPSASPFDMRLRPPDNRRVPEARERSTALVHLALIDRS